MSAVEAALSRYKWECSWPRTRQTGLTIGSEPGRPGGSARQARLPHRSFAWSPDIVPSYPRMRGDTTNRTV